MTARLPGRPIAAALLASLLGLCVGREPVADSPENQVKVSLEVVTNPVAGAPSSACAVSEIAPAEGMNWWVAFGQAEPDPEGGWQLAGTQAGCGRGPGAPAATSFLTAQVRTVSGLLPSVLTPERVLVLNVSVSLQKLSGFSKEGKPIDDSSEIKRSFYFQSQRAAVIPLFEATEAEAGAFGIHEVFLKITPEPVRDESSDSYGAVVVLSGLKGGEILLDGGVAGTIGPGRETLLRNVTRGWHDVRVRDLPGHEFGKAVNVVAGRTVLVEPDGIDRTQSPAPYRLVALGRNAQGFEEHRRERDGAVVVRIPAGEILMGNKQTEGAPLEHRVYVSEFLMDKVPVTWRQFKVFAAATGTSLPPHEPYWGIHDDHSAVFVTWEEAKAYCEWTGGRLPTEAEREKGARGTDDRKYPWGNEEPDQDRAVFRREWGWEATEPVGSRPHGASPYGLLDMGGNVWEFCADWYDRDYYQNGPKRDPMGPSSGISRVVRGGSWDSRPSVLSASCRNWAYRGYREGDFGFRCAMNAPK